MTVALARLQHAAHHVLLRGGGDKYIDEARSGDLQLFDNIGLRQGRNQSLCNITRRFTQGFSQLHRQIASVIAVRGLLGAFD